jgi:hypothetical protein
LLAILGQDDAVNGELAVSFLVKHPATLNDRLAGVARDDLADTFTGVAEVPEPVAEDVLTAQRRLGTAEDAS